MSGYYGNDDIEVYSFTVCPFSSHACAAAAAAVAVVHTATFVFAHFFLYKHVHVQIQIAMEQKCLCDRSMLTTSLALSHTMQIVFVECAVKSKWKVTHIGFTIAFFGRQCCTVFDRYGLVGNSDQFIYKHFVVFIYYSNHANIHTIRNKQASKHVCIPRWHIYTIIQHFRFGDMDGVQNSFNFTLIYRIIDGVYSDCLCDCDMGSTVIKYQFIESKCPSNEKQIAK